VGARALQCGAVGSGTDTRRGGTGRSVGVVACGRVQSVVFFFLVTREQLEKGKNWANQRLSFRLRVELGSWVNKEE
jgi:hypothetical protein